MAAWGESIKDWNNLENFLQNAEVGDKFRLPESILSRGVRQQRINNLASLEQEVDRSPSPPPHSATQVVLPLLTYRHQFEEVKARVDKCEARRVQCDRSLFLFFPASTHSFTPEQPSWRGSWKPRLPQTGWRRPGLLAVRRLGQSFFHTLGLFLASALIPSLCATFFLLFWLSPNYLIKWIIQDIS